MAAEMKARLVTTDVHRAAHQATHWTGRAIGQRRIGISLGSVQRLWRAHKLQPHRLRTYKRSRAPCRLSKLTDIVGLYVIRRRHAVVLTIDEEREIKRSTA